MDLILDRSIQKTLAMIIGAFICWLGYRLFITGIRKDKAELSFTKGEIKLQILNASPGIFFSLFGAVIIIISILQKESFKESTRNKDKTTDREWAKSFEDSEKSEENMDYYYIGMQLVKEQKYDGATFCLEHAFEQLSDFSELYNNLAYLYSLEKREDFWDKGIILVKMALLIRPEESEYYETLSELYYKKGMRNEAINCINKAINNAPKKKKKGYVKKLELYQTK